MGTLQFKTLLLFVMLLFVSSQCFADPLVDSTPEEVFAGADFYVIPRANYAGSFWVVDQSNNKIIGYAPWDPLKRRWTLFSLNSEYQGFLQATVGDTRPPHFTQYLYYDRDNRYKGVFIAALGGRPVTPELPNGELGGTLDLYEIGNIPVRLPDFEPEVDPLRKFPEGVDVGPIQPPSGRPIN
ncbi:hypothetical protein [Desulfomonile tiedjei]|uniref:Uncharacterized protein n=1 Tax=Desulfomonile tiedjei (strain ATCC 49306 / DSM 6799 / DCB-1) TaxID=706587 RepID=I4C278_DESTA|nr:hypothetical protein [Desulfomonile tiedjei]AFM23669.1 hypothetical protein Desti_0950 [Desulfomonile tiedjei DSM 6799]